MRWSAVTEALMPSDLAASGSTLQRQLREGKTYPHLPLAVRSMSKLTDPVVGPAVWASAGVRKLNERQSYRSQLRLEVHIAGGNVKGRPGMVRL